MCVFRLLFQDLRHHLCWGLILPQAKDACKSWLLGCINGGYVKSIRSRHTLLILCGLLFALLLACATAAGAVRAGMIAPVMGAVTLGRYTLDTAIENRICLQRVLKQPCSPPIYMVRLSIAEPLGTSYYRLLGMRISERYVFYP